MAKAIKQIERQASNVNEERTEDLTDILKQIADSREAIQVSLVIIQELYNSGVLNMIKGFLKTRENVGSIIINQLNQPSVYNIIKNAINSVELLSSLDPNQLQAIFGGLHQGLQKASENIDENSKQIGLWEILRAMRDPNIQASLNMMLQFLSGMGEGLNHKQVHE
ncbi:DUF1641 domain-containing protein [Heyndrickxia ginsengihumi]|uniref:DUF1641 domain-containing protein n=1 Tax=Heyndrickxia ginsengihumi TaxID=363870 RepID=A0A0A6XW26_9BACI|nr:DUF1641 domain-containing protein [Heyndrickxia ginsengihumi]KHD84327.1 hypothetical protein NG54_16300 [Heyndrickxia ginsengihumi]MBE6183295.1 DUF1641 domain-containing protein [Bacillus sp. (in: firmicutes)]MCM3022290.1 DUF1641 domain-containing protein [Heyndrickxia ginsengihumi]NEY18524.1 DUF1641 domain-containing protein [Heyndrickxia ginsengihumi]